MQVLVSLIAGLVFGLGLILAGMTDPAKVLAFLDLFGAWNPSLALVMGGAIAVTAPLFFLIERRGRSWDGQRLALPPRTGIDARLLAGGLIFGLGWGLAGYCPGPALVALGEGRFDALIFVPAMLIGMAVVDRLSASR